MTYVSGLVWLILLAGLLAIIHRRLHFETQLLFLQITHRKEIALILYSLLLLPGVFLHECSHYLVARMLGVKTGRFSLIPQPMADGRLRLGFVETASTDILRDSLIGIAPFLTGGAFVTYVGLNQLGLSIFWEGIIRAEFGLMWEEFLMLYSRQDFWLWFYLTFAVSSTMLPSASDRRAWIPLGLLLLGLVILFLFIDRGLGGLIGLTNLFKYFEHVIQTVNLIFMVTIFVHVLVLPVVWLMRNSLTHLNRMKFFLAF
jgi:hypothetical protein